ncbi:DinB family protein [Larkinella terrae]|uniref:DinB family protein n=1 Tax=Larkinella terrae TaxID=2025311 RepID=A0A7K0ELB1_9BACT|nr:DinB family protein [Larkinella terrae]MRS62607.1 DinB family protein [Larkinella terrae]
MKYGYAETHRSYGESIQQLREYIEELPGRMRAFSDEELMERKPGKWSRKEILGHLIDSGLNNLKRFTDAQFLPSPFVVQRYDQNQSVVFNRYHELPLEHLLTYWQALNRQIVYVTERIPEEILQKPVIPPGDSETVTLAWLIDDYVAHMGHHFKQFQFQ